MKKRVHPTFRIAAAPLLMVGLALPVVTNCNGVDVPTATCPELEAGDMHTLKLEGPKKSFLTAAVELDKFALHVEEELIETCQRMGRVLGVHADELDVDPALGEGAKQVCDLVAEQITKLYGEIGEAKLEITYDPPRCEQDVEVTKACYADCDASFDASKSELTCKDGAILGVCEDACVGSCVLNPGSYCTGTCDGLCRGTCDGKKSADGKPARCSGTCQGSCSGSCTVESKAPPAPPPKPASGKDDDKKPKKNRNCRGRCQGTCSDGLRNAVCNGEATAKVAEACVTTCAVAVAPSTTCSSATLTIDVDEPKKAPPEPGKPPKEPTDEEKEQLKNRRKLMVALRMGLPRIIELQHGLHERLTAKVDALVKLGATMTSSGDNKAAVCVNGANDILGDAAMSFRVSAQVASVVSAAARLDAKGTNAPSAAKPSDAKPSDAKPSDAKPSDAKPSDAKPSDAKPSDAKPSDAKPSDAKPSAAKPSAAKPSAAKPADKPAGTTKPSEPTAPPKPSKQ